MTLFSKKIIVIVLLCLTLTTVNSQLDNLVGAFRTVLHQTMNYVWHRSNLMPMSSEIRDQSIDYVFGTPAKMMLDAVTLLCTQFIALTEDLDTIPKFKPSFENVNFILMDQKYNKSFGINQVDEMLNFETFNKSNPVVILTTGWLSMRKNFTNDCRESIYSGYFCREDTNFILFNTADYITTTYFVSAKNTKILGEFLGKFIMKMTAKVPLRNFHLIGHSLGAQISGAAGRHFTQLTGLRLPRITGLDAARPCFHEGQELGRIGRGDAEFVDMIHSNNGGWGIRNPVGDADFYPNGKVTIQPIAFDIITSHNFACDVYGESVYPGAEMSFMAKRCDSLYSYNRGVCRGLEVPMGYATPLTAKGYFILKTAHNSPFGTAKINSCPKISGGTTTSKWLNPILNEIFSALD